MATFTSILFMVTILVATTSAAPNKKFSLKIPDACKNKGFCNVKPEGYDELQEFIKTLMTPAFMEQIIGDRNGGVGEPYEELSPKADWDNCPYRTKTEQLSYAYNHANGSSPDVIVQNDMYLQPYNTTTCATELISVSSPVQCFAKTGLGFFKNTRCVTSTALRSFLLFDLEKKKLKTKAYEINCCCSCITS